MMVRRLSNAGIERFVAFLRGLETAPGDRPAVLLESQEFSEPFDPTVVIEERSFSSRLEVAEYLYARFHAAGASGVENDRGLWAWLALFYFDTLCPPDKRGRRKPGALARWVPDGDFKRYYRHLLAGPYRIYRAYRREPELALGLLCTPPSTMGEIVEQIASRQELVTNRAVVGTVTALYVDSAGGLKRGAGGKGAGSPRRLADVLAQLDLTYDLYSMEPSELLAMLPQEFDRFKRPG